MSRTLLWKSSLLLLMCVSMLAMSACEEAEPERHAVVGETVWELEIPLEEGKVTFLARPTGAVKWGAKGYQALQVMDSLDGIPVANEFLLHWTEGRPAALEAGMSAVEVTAILKDGRLVATAVAPSDPRSLPMGPLGPTSDPTAIGQPEPPQVTTSWFSEVESSAGNDAWLRIDSNSEATIEGVLGGGRSARGPEDTLLVRELYVPDVVDGIPYYHVLGIAADYGSRLLKDGREYSLQAQSRIFNDAELGSSEVRVHVHRDEDWLIIDTMEILETDAGIW